MSPERQNNPQLRTTNLPKMFFRAFDSHLVEGKWGGVGAWLAQVVEPATPDLRVVTSSPTLGTEII